MTQNQFNNQMKCSGEAMRYLHTMIRVSNLEKSIHFFCTVLGLVEKTRYDSIKGRYTNVFLYAKGDEKLAMETRAPQIELTYNWPDEHGNVEKYTSGRNFGHIAYLVDDIYAYCAHLQKNGIVINRPPRDGHMAFIKSPDGISIELLQKGEPKPIQSPWKDMENVGSW